MNTNSKTVTLALILMSFALCSFVIVVVAGLWNTPFSTADSAGRTMGFNDQLSPEHYGIIVSNFRVQTLMDLDYLYTWFLLAMHGWGAWLIVRQPNGNLCGLRRFFVVQGLLFPVGWIGFFVLPWTLRSVAEGRLDREGIIDIPFIAITAHPVWIATAMLIAFGLLRTSSRSLVSGGSVEPHAA